MNVLITGASSFLGYHVARLLTEQSVRPRVLELRGSNLDPLARIDVERCAGSLEDPDALAAACTGVDILIHLAFKVNVGGGARLIEEMREVNLGGTRRLLDAAAAKGVSRVVVAGSALGVGVNHRPVPLDERADWSEHAFALPYALLRRQAEQESLARARPGFSVVALCPAFTMGPDDPVGAPANKLIEALVRGKMPITLTVGFGCLDVRDFAYGALLAAHRGRPGQRYLLSGHNIMTRQLLEEVSAIAGVRVPRFEPPKVLLSALVGAVEFISRIRGKPAPLTREALEILGRYAWYDTSRARTELGWEPRPLRRTLEDTIRWLREVKGIDR